MNLSVIIPCFLKSSIHENLLYEALFSLIKQKFKSFETILVINGSFDKENSVEYRIKQKFSNLLDLNLFFFKECKNGAFCRNFGISKSKYDLICQLDSDDMYEENKLQKQVDFFEKNSYYDFIGTRFYILKNKVKIKDNIYYRGNHPICESHEEISNVIFKKNPLCHSSILFKKEKFNKLNGYDETIRPYHFCKKYNKKMCEDWDLWIRAIENDMKFYIIPEFLYIYRQGYSVT